MADKKVLVTTSGVYALDDKGNTVELAQGSEAILEQKQAESLAKRGRVELVNNSKPQSKSKSEK